MPEIKHVNSHVTLATSVSFTSKIRVLKKKKRVIPGECCRHFSFFSLKLLLSMLRVEHTPCVYEPNCCSDFLTNNKFHDFMTGTPDASTSSSAAATSAQVDVNPTTVVDMSSCDEEEKTFSNDPVDTASPLNEAASVVSALFKEERC